MSHVQIQFTIDDPAQADGIIEQLLTRRLVACGQRMGPVVSRYWWAGALERTEEWLVLVKTRGDLASVVMDTVVTAHPYDTPEIVVLTVAAGSPDYLSWIDSVTGTAGTIGQAEETEE